MNEQTDPTPPSAVDLAELERHAARIAYYGQIGLGPLGHGGDRYLGVTDGDGGWAPFATVGDEDAEAIAALLNAAPALVAEIRRCWAGLYPHRLYTFYQPGTGVAMPACFYCNRYETSGYCAERHKRTLEEQQP